MSLFSKIFARNMAIIQGSDATNRALSRNPLSNDAELSNAIDGTTAKMLGAEANTLDTAINKDIKEQFCYNFF